jgi:hypothetical protein
MKYYAKITGPHPGGSRIYVEIWEVQEEDGFVVDNLLKSKKFFTYRKAKKWIDATIMSLIAKNKMQYFFIKDTDIIRKELS